MLITYNDGKKVGSNRIRRPEVDYLVQDAWTSSMASREQLLKI